MKFAKWLFGAILAISLATAGVAFLYSWSPGNSLQEAPRATAVAPRMTAKTAYSMALPIASSWASDATLVIVQGTWNPEDDFQSGEGNWTVVFYSSEQASTALISVVNARANLVNVRAANKPLDPGKPGTWEIDSPEVIHQLLLEGGAEFLRSQPGSSLVLALSLVEPAGWKGRLIHKESRRTFSAQLDAANGQLVAANQTG